MIYDTTIQDIILLLWINKKGYHIILYNQLVITYYIIL